MTHNLPGFKNEPQSEYHFASVFFMCRLNNGLLVAVSKPRTDLSSATVWRRGCCQIDTPTWY